MSQNTSHIYLSIENNKTYLINQLSQEINEIIRILQLTACDEDDWLADDSTWLKQKLVIRFKLCIFHTIWSMSDLKTKKSSFEVKLKGAVEWLSDEAALNGGVGEKSMRSALHDADLIGNKFEASNHNSILDSSNQIKPLLDNLCTIIQENKVVYLI